jgi:hypothetical protein
VKVITPPIIFGLGGGCWEKMKERNQRRALKKQKVREKKMGETTERKKMRETVCLKI